MRLRQWLLWVDYGRPWTWTRPRIVNTTEDLGGKPKVSMEEALRRIFEAYRSHGADARTLLN